MFNLVSQAEWSRGYYVTHGNNSYFLLRNFQKQVFACSINLILSQDQRVEAQVGNTARHVHVLTC